MPTNKPSKTAKKPRKAAAVPTRTHAPPSAAKRPQAPTAPRDQPVAATGTKQSQLLTLLRRKSGVTIAEAAQALGWQHHSVRGVLSGVIKKKLKLTVQKIPDDGSAQHYRLAE
jgi:hypothetical protein